MKNYLSRLVVPCTVRMVVRVGGEAVHLQKEHHVERIRSVISSFLSVLCVCGASALTNTVFVL